jgi:muconolactone delta-isomerase
MEFLVDMTTHVPDGTPPERVDEVRAREADHSRGLARDGRLLRLWRPPLQPGQWRTWGLFDAADADALETVLAGMPLRIWRTDTVTPLAPHPNDPAAAGIAAGPPGDPEFLITMTVTVPPGTAEADATGAFAREARRAHELAEQGQLVRLWSTSTEPNRFIALGLWRAHDEDQIAAVVKALPLHEWMTADIVPLTKHPNDPA